jgi:hypothetical protein
MSNIFLLISVLFALGSTIATAEVEYELHTNSSSIICRWRGLGNAANVPSGFPILISLTDKKGGPIKGAIVVLKRLVPDGWSEEELKREKDCITDKNGMIAVLYPDCYATEDDYGISSVAIYGAVTVIADGHPSVTVELGKYFKSQKYVLSENSAPHITIALENGLADRGAAEQKPVQQPVHNQEHPSK